MGLPVTLFTGNSGDQKGGPGRAPFLYMEAVAQPAATGTGAPIATSKMRLSWWATAQVSPSPYARGLGAPVRKPPPAREGASFPAVPPTNSAVIHTSWVRSPAGDGVVLERLQTYLHRPQPGLVPRPA